MLRPARKSYTSRLESYFLDAYDVIDMLGPYHLPAILILSEYLLWNKHARALPANATPPAIYIYTHNHTFLKLSMK